MKPISLFYTLLLLIFSSFQAQAQSLYQDAKTLVATSQLLDEKGYDLQDSAALDAFSRMIAILYEYDNPMAPEFSNARMVKLAKRYRENPRIPDLIPLDSLVATLDSTRLELITAFRSHSDSLHQAPRQKMVGLLRGDYGSSPAEYLSVSRALREYSVPPVETSIALEQMAEESNRNIQNGIINPQALIEGLFLFVLERAQEEVVINFMERFLTKEVVQYEELFPTVVSQFNDPGQTYSNSFIERVRDAFYEDLQMLSVRLPSIVLNEERFAVLQEDPLIYNLLAVYSIVGMAQNDVPLEEIIPITFRNLYENYYQTQKKVNFMVAEAPSDTPEYQELVQLTKDCVDRIKDIYIGLNDGESEILSGISQIVLDDPNGDGISTPAFTSTLLPAYSLEMLMGNDTTADFRLNLLPSLLAGHLDTAYVLGFRNVDAYDKFFGEERTPGQWKAAGLELARNLNGTWFADNSIDQILRNWAADLTTYKMAYEQWKIELIPGSMERTFQELEDNRQALRSLIQETQSFWEPHLTGNQGLAFDMLGAIISDDYSDVITFIQGLGGLDLSEEQLQAMGMEAISAEAETQKLIDVETRLIELNDKISAEFPDQQTGNPVHQYFFEQKGAHPYAGLLAQIDILTKDLRALKLKLDALDQVSAPSEMKIMENARPMLGLTELATHLMYCLRSGSADPEQKWITKAQLDTLVNNQALNNAFQGLLYQRLCQVQQVDRISPEGMARLVQLTVNDLPYLVVPEEADTLEGSENLNFYYTASFIVNTLNRVLEIPFIVDPAFPDAVLPLQETNPTLGNISELSEMILDLIYYLNIRDHRHAMSSAIRLFLIVENFEADESVHEFLKKYGFFIADMVDAESSNEVQSLLNGIADPPGSSRLKRQKKLTAGLNAYLGGSVGSETWERTTSSVQDQFISIAPTMPIGISMSGRLGNGIHPPSFSLFLSLLDLGSILSYRGSDSPFGDYKLTYKNMFKPSLQVHWNVPNSPFYMGVGGQIGRQYIDNLQGEEVNLRSTRFFFSFGIDVPIKTFFTK